MPAPDDELELTGQVRPKLIPKHWIGEPLPDERGWRWCDPNNRNDAVRICRGDPDAADETDRSTYVIITVNGELIARHGEKTGEFLFD